jgi:hypothetical protein
MWPHIHIIYMCGVHVPCIYVVYNIMYTDVFFLFHLFFRCVCVHVDEPEYWWFELMILFNKTMMCGGLVVLAPGSPIQVLFAVLIMLVHLLFLLRLAPYVKDSEDWSSFFATLGLCLVSLGALMMMINLEQNEAKTVGLVTTVLPMLCIATVIGIMIMYDFGLKQRCCGDSGDGAASNNMKKISSTQVQPINNANNETMLDVQAHTAQQQEKHQMLRNWGIEPPNKLADKPPHAAGNKETAMFIPKKEEEIVKEPVTKVIASNETGRMGTVMESQQIPAVTSRKQLRDMKKKFGAQSDEYKSALKQMGQQRKSSVISKT